MTYELANIVWIYPKHFQQPGSAVFERLKDYLPLSSRVIISNEIDIKEDMQEALSNLSQFNLRNKAFSI